MTSRGQRLAAALTSLAVLLFAGRWVAEFLTDQWWAGTVSPGIRLLLARRALLGLALDAAGIVVASGWFLLQVAWLWHTFDQLGPRERGGNPVIRQALKRPGARNVARAAAVLFGILAGSGLSALTDDLLLASSGLRYGVAEPALGTDLGFFLVWFPVWLRVHAFVAVLVLTSLGLVAVTYLVAGAVRIGRGRLAITAEARRHLGILLACLGLVIGASKVLEPYELAAGIPVVLDLGVIRLHRSVGMVLVGMSLAVAALSLIWSRRPVHSLAAGGWFALSAALVLANYLLPADRPDIRDSEYLARRSDAEALAFGLDQSPMPAELTQWRPSLWSFRSLDSGATAADSARAPWRVEWADSTGRYPARIALAPQADGSRRVLAVRDDAVRANGLPLALALPEIAVPAAGSWPGAPLLTVGSGGGVEAGSPGRRLALAWALQRWSLLGAEPAQRVGWYHDPERRLSHALPFVSWHDATPRVVEDRLVWLVDGYTVAEAFPGIRRRPWFERTAAFVRAGFVAVVDAATGATAVYLRPGADSLSAAWARAVPDVIRPMPELPGSVKAQLGYPLALLRLQAEILAERIAPTSGVRVGGGGPGPEAGDVAVAIMTGPEQLHAVAVGRHRDGIDGLTVFRPDSTGGLEAPETLIRRWKRFPLLEGIEDSAQTAGAAVLTDPVRFTLLPEGLTAYWPVWARAAGAEPAVVVVALAQADRLAVGRTVEEARRALAAGTTTRERLLGDETVLEAVRRLVREADSVLRAGDMAGFGTRFGQLRELLQEQPDTASSRR